jgi:hypothetical protein
VKSDEALPDDIIRQTAEYMKAASAIYKMKKTPSSIDTRFFALSLTSTYK